MKKPPKLPTCLQCGRKTPGTLLCEACYENGRPPEAMHMRRAASARERASDRIEARAEPEADA